jgi:hypothetical protein
MFKQTSANVKVLHKEQADPKTPEPFLVNIATLKTILPKLSGTLDISYELLRENTKLKDLCLLSTHSQVSLIHDNPEDEERAFQIAELIQHMVKENAY